MGVSIKYSLIGRGWSECTVDISDQICTVTASYLSNSLKELIWSVNYIVKGGSEIKFSFDEEPGEYRWILARLKENAISIEILEFDELWGNKEGSEGRIIYDTACSVFDFALALQSSLDNLLDEYGLVGYKEKWGNAEFPINEYRELCSLLGKLPSGKALQPDAASPRR